MDRLGKQVPRAAWNLVPHRPRLLRVPPHLVALAVLLALATGCAVNYSSLEEELARTGVTAGAEILRVWDTGIGSPETHQIVMGMEVQVRPPDRPPYKTTIENTTVLLVYVPQFQPGKMIEVMYDPKNPARVAVVGNPNPDHLSPESLVLGIKFRALSDLEKARLRGDHGIVVLAVLDGSPAAAVHILPGDLIVAIDGKQTADENVPALLQSIAGRSVLINLMRDEAPLSATVQLNRVAP